MGKKEKNDHSISAYFIMTLSLLDFLKEWIHYCNCGGNEFIIEIATVATE